MMTRIAEKKNDFFIGYPIYDYEAKSAQLCQTTSEFRLTLPMTSCNGLLQNKPSLFQDEPMDFSASSKLPHPTSVEEKIKHSPSQNQILMSSPPPLNDTTLFANEKIKSPKLFKDNRHNCPIVDETICQPLPFKDFEMIREEFLLREKIKCHARERNVLATAGLLNILPSKTAIDGDGDDELIWKDGVGYLPGTSLRFHKSAGILELIDDCTASFMDDGSSNGVGENDIPYSAPRKSSIILNTCKRVKTINEEKIYEDNTDHRKANLKLNKCENVATIKNSTKQILFNWTNYLKETDARAAPIRLFQHLPMNLNCTACGFKRGMLLEGIDPQHESLYCVMSVVEVVGWRIRLHFEGYSELFDFWTNSYSPLIFAPGWCSNNKRNLQPPKGQKQGVLFDWRSTSLLCQADYQLAPQHLFSTPWILHSLETTESTSRGFHIGLKLEASRKHNVEQICVATVADFLEQHILIHIDGCDATEDYWTDLNSPNIYSAGWCSKNGRLLTLPIGWVSDAYQLNDKNAQLFTWSNYLRQCCATAVPESAFKPRCPLAFKHGHKLEAVDRRFSKMLRVATVSKVKPYSLTLHFDGLDSKFDLNFKDDCCDIFPVGYAERTGHPLEDPFSFIHKFHSEEGANPSCSIAVCGGLAHVKRVHFTSNERTTDCPYSEENFNRERSRLDRLHCVESVSLESDTRVLLPHQRYRLHVQANGKPKLMAEAAATKAATAVFKKHHNLFLQIASSNNCNANSRRKGRRNKYRNAAAVSSSSTFAKVAAAAALAAATAATESIASLSVMMEREDEDHKETLFWAQQRRLLPAIESASNSSNLVLPSISQWSPSRVADFVRQLPNCASYAQSMIEHEVDGEAFLLLEHIDLCQCLGLPLGPVLKIASAIKTLHHDNDNRCVK